ncbi:MAG: hypothetical protein IJ508_02585, partial [Oscillospiraceae bacterium]|nr:hypothetical protein [Oscillospiraceae bacterium]
MILVPLSCCGARKNRRAVRLLDFFDRCHSLASLHRPQGAVGSLPGLEPPVRSTERHKRKEPIPFGMSSFLVPLTGPTSLCCAKSYCFARYTRKALGLKTPHRGVFFTASPLSGPIPISKNTGYPDGVSGILVPLTGIEPVQYCYRGILSP